MTNKSSVKYKKNPDFYKYIELSCFHLRILLFVHENEYNKLASG